LSQIRLTDALTFMSLRLPLHLPNDAAARQIPRRQFHDHLIPDQHSHEVPIEPTADVRRYPGTLNVNLIQAAGQLRRDPALHLIGPVP
jgi:hypothetical protein